MRLPQSLRTVFLIATVAVFLGACEELPDSPKASASGQIHTADVAGLGDRYGTIVINKDAKAFEPQPEPPSVDQIIEDFFGSVTYQARKIVTCESGFNPNAVSPTNDHGLFQINQVHKRKFPEVTGQPWSSVYDPYYNTMYAKFLYDESGWRPWTCRKAL